MFMHEEERIASYILRVFVKNSLDVHLSNDLRVIEVI